MHRLICFLSLFFLLSQPLYAAQLAERVHEEHLENGLTLLMLERHDAPTVSAFISFRVGGANEGAQNRGIAHLLLKCLQWNTLDHLYIDGENFSNLGK